MPFEKNIQKAHDRKAQKYRDLVSDILDNGFTCDLTCFEIGSRGLITPENIRNIDKIFSFVNTKPSKSFRKELSKVALLTSYPSGTLNRSRPGALKIKRCSAPDFLSSWRCPLLLLGSFLNFFASHLLLLFYMFLCVYSPASKRALGSLLVLGLNVLPFVMHFALVVCNVWIKVDITQ